MPKMKVNMGTPAAPNWVVMDSKDALTLQGKSAADFSLVGHGHTFSSLTSIPTTLAGYGISDNVVISEANSIKPRWDPTLGAIRMKVDTTDNLPVALAKAVNGIEFRMNAGILEYNDGTGWKGIMVSPIKSIQRGVGYGTINISAINVSKSIIIVNGRSLNGSYGTPVDGEILNSTQIKISGYAADGTQQTGVWQVIEYV